MGEERRRKRIEIVKELELQSVGDSKNEREREREREKERERERNETVRISPCYCCETGKDRENRETNSHTVRKRQKNKKTLYKNKIAERKRNRGNLKIIFRQTRRKRDSKYKELTEKYI
jgi:hypothetical protein